MEYIGLAIMPILFNHTGVVARASCRVHRDIESLRGRMGESERQVEGSFESLLAESFGG